MKVLVPTNDKTFSVDLCNEYRNRGFDVRTGTDAFFDRNESFDLIHCHWPEELCGWKTPPDSSSVSVVLEALDWWRQRAHLICSVHNLIPHAAGADDAVVRRYYGDFYARMHHIGHFSHTSIEWVSELFSEVQADRHFFHGLNLFDGILALSPGRVAARQALGLGQDDLALLTFGQVRTTQELALLHRGIEGAGADRRRILFCARLPQGRLFATALRRMRHEFWCVRTSARRFEEYLNDHETAALFAAADILLIPRYGRNLNSGLLPLALTFGTPMAAPDFGVFGEYLSGERDQLYRPADPKSLSGAIDRLAARSLEQVRASNLARAASCGWRAIVDRVLERIGQRDGPSGHQIAPTVSG